MVKDVDEFLGHKRLAMIGVSHNPKEFSRMVFRAFRERDFDVAPVNPSVREVEGVKCYARVQDVEPAVDAALVMTLPAVAEQVVTDCAEAGIRHVWLYRKSPVAEAFCAARGMTVIAGECPMMFLSHPGWIHRFHGWLHGVHPIPA